MPGPKNVAISNRQLAALPQKDYQQLLAYLKPVELEFGDILYEAGDQIRYVYFPEDCLVSLLTAVDANRAAEVGLVGSEGMIGVPVALGIFVSPFLAVVQGAGTALRMKTVDFRREFGKSAALQGALFRFTHLLMIQVAQTAACNRFHVVTQRLARWLLMTRDRVHANEFLLTQEFLGRMLGVRRVGVTAAASALQKLKLISYSRGNITIIDPAGLEAAACGCYETVNSLYAKAKRSGSKSDSRLKITISKK
ncbi:MAG: Crp/Fnr family transcriptional regulator [Betaproteobacteria bacterium]